MSDPQGPADAFRLQIAQVRAGRGMSQGDLVKRLQELGVETKKGNPIDRATLARIEAGKRRVTLEEAIQIAAALEVPPLYLIVPRQARSEFSITPTLTVSSETARAWLAGMEPLPGHDWELMEKWAPEQDPELEASMVHMAQEELEKRTEELIEQAAQAAASGVTDEVRQVLRRISTRRRIGHHIKEGETL